MAGRKLQEHRRQADQTWLRPPRSVVEKIEALLELGKSDTAIRNHNTMVDYDISLQQIADIRDDYEAARDWEVRALALHLCVRALFFCVCALVLCACVESNQRVVTDQETP